ncbi:hypothetical protein [Streptomyces sp. NPDC002156]
MTEQQATEQAEEIAVPVVPSLPPLPEAPPLAPPPVKPVKKDRRVLRAALRWTAAVVVFAAVGASAAYGITRMERTDVPGLATESDGRWDYPTLVKPPLPSGSPAPFAEANAANAHYADLRELVLPAPEGAKDDAALRGTDGWLAKKTFLEAYASEGERETVDQILVDHGLRHIAARGWTTPDGTRTAVYLLRFGSAVVVDDIWLKIFGYDAPKYALKGASALQTDAEFPVEAAVDDVRAFPYAETKPYGAEQVRAAYLSAGDTLGLIVQSRKGTAEAVPFQQTVVLQAQLLG